MNFYEKQSFWAWTTAILLLASVGAIVYYYKKNNNQNQNPNSQVVIHSGLPQGYQASPSPSGTYPALMPKDAILYPLVKPSSGAVVQPGEKAAQQVVSVFAVSDSIEQVFKKYESGLTAKNWVLATSNLKTNLAYQRFIKNGDYLEVTAIPLATTTQVQITFIPNPKAK